MQGDFKKDDMMRFVRQTSGQWIGLPGCLEVFDSLAKQFVAAKQSPSDRKVILRQAEDAWDNVSLASERKSAEVYVKVMRKLIEKGDDFLKSEQTRVEGLRQGKLSQDKKDDMERRLNILQSFQPLKKVDQKSELWDFNEVSKHIRHVIAFCTPPFACYTSLFFTTSLRFHMFDDDHPLCC